MINLVTPENLTTEICVCGNDQGNGKERIVRWTKYKTERGLQVGNYNFHYDNGVLCDNYVPQLWVEITMSWVGCLLKDFELFILFVENSHILLKISATPILLTFIYLVALNLLVNNQLNSSFNSTH